MKTLLLSVAFALSALSASAHEYFFAFAELDYNAATRSFEITLEGAAHDIEDVLQENGIAILELEDHYTDTEMLAKIETFINNGFSLTSGETTPRLKLIGMEVKPTGQAFFYLLSEPVTLAGQLDIRFDWLMDALPQQQNKITLRYNERLYSAVFLPHKRRETIEL